MKDLQLLISGLAYPPTHTYVLTKASQVPTGVLAARYDAMRELAPQFWTPADTMFLDVGCNKGFFVLAARELFPQVVGIDYTAGYADLCRSLLPSGIFHGVGFRDYVPKHQFGRVLIANGHHHLFREAGGWGWIPKLAVITAPEGLVLVEGIPNEQDPDGHEFPGLTESMFLCEMGDYFDLIEVGASVDYTPGRKIWLFRRNPSSLSEYKNHALGAGSVPLRRGAVTTGGDVSPRWHKARIAKAGDLVYKTYCPLPPTPLWPRIAIASMAEGATRISHWATRGGQVVGWAERAQTPRSSELGFSWFDYQESLLAMGYVDTDPNDCNVVGGLTVDKGGVFPVAELTPEHFDYVNGSMALALRSMHKTEEYIMGMCSAMAKRGVDAILGAL